MKRFVWAALAATAAWGSLQPVALAAPPPPAPKGQPGSDSDDAGGLPVAGVITNPDWVQKPGSDEFSRYYPPLANVLGLAGKAEITCFVSELGQLERCRVDQEVPLGLGIGKAALSIAPYFHMKPRTIDGVAVAGGQFSTVIRFAMPEWSVDSPAVAGPGSPVPTPRALALADRLVKAQGMSDSMGRYAKQYVDQIRFAIDQDGELDPASVIARKSALDALEGAIAGAAPAVGHTLSQAYAKTFSEDELEHIAEFYESPAGQALIKRQGDVNNAQKRDYEAVFRAAVKQAGVQFCQQVKCLTPVAAASPAPPKSAPTPPPDRG